MGNRRRSPTRGEGVAGVTRRYVLGAYGVGWRLVGDRSADKNVGQTP